MTGLGDLIDDYEFHYPQELNRDNLDEVRERARRPRHLRDRGRPAPRPALRQGRAHARPTTRCGTRRCASTLEAADLAGDIGAQMIIWPGVEGYNYPFQTPYAEAWARLIDGIGQVAERLATARRDCSSSSTRTPSRR